MAPAVNTAFRVDASLRLGVGHLMRCLTLADRLREQGGRTRFVCRELPGDYASVIHGRGHELAVMLGRLTGDETDAAECVALLDGAPWDWVVVDHYALGAAWETAVRVAAPRVLAIDDLADRAHECDVLLDQNYLPDGERRYLGRVPDSCTRLIGPRFALLAPQYHFERQRRRRERGTVKQLLVFFGGTDPDELTERTLAALLSVELAHLTVDIVFTGAPSRLERLEQLVRARPRTLLHGRRPHLADLIARADLAIGGGGATSWERLCLGLPSLVMTMAQNQRDVTEWLDHLGLVRMIGTADTATSSQIRDALIDGIRRSWDVAALERAMSVCDGLGATRVAATMQTYSNVGKSTERTATDHLIAERRSGII